MKTAHLILALLFISLFSGCASFKTKNLIDYFTSRPRITILLPSISVNGSPLSERIAKNQSLIATLKSDVIDPDADFTIKNDSLTSVSIMSYEEFELATALQSEIALSFKAYKTDSIRFSFPCDVDILAETEKLFAILENNNSKPLFIPDTSFKTCVHSIPSDMIILSRLVGEYKTEIITNNPGYAATLIMPPLATISDLAKITGIAERNYKLTQGQSYFEMAIIDAKESKILFYNKSYLAECPIYKETLQKLVEMNYDNIFNTKK